MPKQDTSRVYVLDAMQGRRLPRLDTRVRIYGPTLSPPFCQISGATFFKFLTQTIFSLHELPWH